MFAWYIQFFFAFIKFTEKYETKENILKKKKNQVYSQIELKEIVFSVPQRKIST